MLWMSEWQRRRSRLCVRQRMRGPALVRRCGTRPPLRSLLPLPTPPLLLLQRDLFCTGWKVIISLNIKAEYTDWFFFLQRFLSNCYKKNQSASCGDLLLVIQTCMFACNAELLNKNIYLYTISLGFWSSYFHFKEILPPKLFYFPF